MPLEFTEYHYAAAWSGTRFPVPSGPEIITQSIAIAAERTRSEPFDALTRLIVLTRIDVDCRIAIGANPQAVTAGPGQTRFVKAGSEYAFDVTPGQFLETIL